MKKLILIIALALVSTGAWGDKYTVLGWGNDGCGKFVAAKQEDSTKFYLYKAWILGFISGGNLERSFNEGNPQIGKEIDTPSIALWLENYCRENPLDNLSYAADALVEELIRKE